MVLPITPTHTDALHRRLTLLQKWRKRFFLLRRSGSLPSQYVLEYFSDESKRKLKGKIELDQCEQVSFG